MSQGSQKNYLFYSNQCQHSKRLLLQIQKTPIINTMQMVNIDDPKVQLPNFVQSVPTLYLPGKRQVLTDTHLFKWFDEELKKESENASKVKMADITGDDSILPFQMSEMGNGLAGAVYSFIEEDKNDLMNQNYSFLQDRDINKMPDFTRFDAATSSDSSKNGAATQKKTGGGTDTAYDQMMKARGNDMQKKSPPQVPNFASPY
jgi:hypothetical protein